MPSIANSSPGLLPLFAAVAALWFAAPVQSQEPSMATSRVANNVAFPRRTTPGPWGLWWGMLNEKPMILDLAPGRFAVYQTGASANEPGEKLSSGPILRVGERWHFGSVRLGDAERLPDFAIAEHDQRDLILVADNGNAVTFSRGGDVEDVETRFHRLTGAWRKKNSRNERLIISPGRFELKIRERRRNRWSVKSFGTWNVESGKLQLRYVADLETRSFELTGYRTNWELVSLRDERFVVLDDTGSEVIYVRSSDPDA